MRIRRVAGDGDGRDRVDGAEAIPGAAQCIRGSVGRQQWARFRCQLETVDVRDTDEGLELVGAGGRVVERADNKAVAAPVRLIDDDRDVEASAVETITGDTRGAASPAECCKSTAGETASADASMTGDPQGAA